MAIRRARRLIWLSVFMLVALTALGGRLYYLQIVKNREYTQMAQRQRAVRLPIGEARGLILDRNGVALTDPRDRWGIGVFPMLLPEADKDRVARTLARALGQSVTAAAALLADLPQQQWIYRTDLMGEAATVAEIGLPGVTVGPVQDRFGSAALARHLVGYMNEGHGVAGLEAAYDQDLSGTATAAMAAFLDGARQPMMGLGIQPVGPGRGKRPYRLETTLDSEVQRVVESVLDGAGSLKGAAVVVEPRTGEVLAMASRPDFAYTADGAPRWTADGALLNRGALAYTPGSIFKLVAAAGALEEGLVGLGHSFVCDGEYDLHGTLIPDHAGGPHGQISFKDAIARSCNVAFMEIGDRLLGVDGLRAAAERFGFGQPTELLGPGREWGEAAGQVPAPGDPGALQMAIGQGELLVTPLQVARFYSAIANGGVLPSLKLVTAVKSPTGEVVSRPAPAGRNERVMSRATAMALQQALLAVTDPKGQGTGKSGWVAGPGSAGKTGTAEVTDTLSHAWFAGYLPASRPDYVVVVLVEGGGSGSGAAAPLFAEIGRELAALNR